MGNPLGLEQAPYRAEKAVRALEPGVWSRGREAEMGPIRGSELTRAQLFGGNEKSELRFCIVGPAGIEPATNGL